MGRNENKPHKADDSGIVVGAASKRRRSVRVRRPSKKQLGLVVLVLAVIGGAVWWYSSSRTETSQPAQTTDGRPVERTTVIAESVADIDAAAQKAIDDNDPAELRRVYDAAIADASDNDVKARLYLGLALGLRTLDDLRGAIEAAERSRELDAQDLYGSTNENLIAYAALALEDFDTALKYFRLMEERLSKQQVREAGVLEEIQDIIRKLEAGEEVRLDAPQP